MKYRKINFGFYLGLLLFLGGCTPAKDNLPSYEGTTSTEAISTEEPTTSVPIASTEASTEATTETPTEVPGETEPETEPEDILEKPVSYQSLGVDKEKRQAFNQKIDASTSLPVISLSTDGSPIVSREFYNPCVVDVLFDGEVGCIQEAPAGIKVRGNSSAHYGNEDEILKDIVPYRLNFFEKTNLLGLNEGSLCKSWVLLKSDWDLIRNDIAYRFGRAVLAADNYCSDAQLVHLYINEKFIGIYLLCEQNEVDPARVDIPIPPQGYTGTDIAYFLELDNYAWSEKDGIHFTMNYANATLTDTEGTTRTLIPAEYSIKSDIYSKEQEKFIANYLNNLYVLLYEACLNHNYLTFDKNYQLVPASYHTAEETVAAVVDLESYVDMYILFEIIHDYDAGSGSFYVSLDFSSGTHIPKLHFTCPWDFNWAYNDEPAGRYYAANFHAQSFVDQYGDRTNPWFVLMMSQDWFVTLVKEKWTALHSQDVLKQCIQIENQIIDTYWDDLNAVEEWATYCARDLITWIETRIAWLDTQWL